ELGVRGRCTGCREVVRAEIVAVGVVLRRRRLLRDQRRGEPRDDQGGQDEFHGVLPERSRILIERWMLPQALIEGVRSQRRLRALPIVKIWTLALTTAPGRSRRVAPRRVRGPVASTPRRRSRPVRSR